MHKLSSYNFIYLVITTVRNVGSFLSSYLDAVILKVPSQERKTPPSDSNSNKVSALVHQSAVIFPSVQGYIL